MALNLSKLLARIWRPVASSRPVASLRPEVEAPLQAGVPSSSTLENAERRAKGESFNLGGRQLRQSTPTTCGAMCFLVARAMRDLHLRQELETNPELIPELEQRYFRQLRAGAVVGLPWPASFGTPPWTISRELSDDGVRYDSIPVDDTSDNARRILRWARNATLAGYPVPLYTGGSLSEDGPWTRKLAVSVPRHVVLAIPGPGLSAAGREQLTIFDPASGRLYDVGIAELLSRTTPLPAFGGWTHLVWAILPTPRQVGLAPLYNT